MKKVTSALIFILPLLLIVSGIGALALGSDESEEDTLTGMVEARQVDVVPKIPGRIISVLVDEGDTVSTGALVVELESKEIDAKVEQARGAVQAARAKWQLAQNGARPEEREAAERLFLQAQHQFVLAEKTYNRVQKVFEEGVVAEQERDQARFKFDAAREQMEAARAQWTIAQKGARVEDKEAAAGLVHQAENALNEATAYQQETRLVSPRNGEIVERLVEPGEVVPAGYPVLTVLDTRDIWVVFQVREDQLSPFKMGAELPVAIPSLGGRVFPFQVTHIAPMADFATWRASNQKGDFDLKTFEIHLRPVKPIAGLRPGMTVRVTH